jgi:hypothetical protein
MSDVIPSFNPLPRIPDTYVQGSGKLFSKSVSPQTALPPSMARREESVQRPVTATADSVTAVTVDARRAAVEQAAKSFAAETFYPLSSVRFTIYKGANGEYITRFTNLQDGTVRTVPEQDILSVARRSVEPLIKVDI